MLYQYSRNSEVETCIGWPHKTSTIDEARRVKHNGQKLQIHELLYIQGSQGCQKIRIIVRNPKLPIPRFTIYSPIIEQNKKNIIEKHQKLREIIINQLWVNFFTTQKYLLHLKLILFLPFLKRILIHDGWIGFDFTKGQFFRKGFWGHWFPPKNERMNSTLLLNDLFSFVFWRKSTIPKKKISKLTDL